MTKGGCWNVEAIFWKNREAGAVENNQVFV